MIEERNAVTFFSLWIRRKKTALNYYYNKRGIQQLSIYTRHELFNWIMYMYIYWHKIVLLFSGYVTLFWILQNCQISLVSQNLVLIVLLVAPSICRSLFHNIQWDLVTTHRVENLWYCTGNFLTSKCSCIFWNIAIEFNKTLLCLYFCFTTKFRCAS